MPYCHAWQFNVIPYSGNFSRTINFAVFEDFATASKINSSKSYCSIESFGSLVVSRILIREMYHGEITLKISSSKITHYTVSNACHNAMDGNVTIIKCMPNVLHSRKYEMHMK